jgi:hypothetical protein
MPKISNLRAELVDTMPNALEDGVIYISEGYRIALHNCCCGCGEEVSTPIGRTEYSITMDDGRVTVEPSIGNHDFPCRSHYLIEKGSIVWAGAMSRRAIKAGRARDRRLKRGKTKFGFAAVVTWLKALRAKLFD